MERYEYLGLVGEGSYGTVMKCRHRDTGQLVAIKKFMDSDSDKTVKKIALREIKLLRRAQYSAHVCLNIKKLHHDNLVNLLEVWKRRRRWYLVFEFVERTLLNDLEQNPRGLDLNTSREYSYQILRAAAFCHEKNIIHRDIKPENILISQVGVVKLCDFGFARTVASPAEGGVYTDYVATRWYRAPELLVGDIQYGKPVDVWAVGCLLIEMLTGQPLFPGDSDLDQLYHIITCFGNLTDHHQMLFYRNPVFSGVQLPECCGRIPLEERFATITPTALDLAQSCLQIDPEGRAHCSELLEHPLFTKDSFHIRFLDDLNARIEKDHREIFTLPKLTKSPRRDKDEGNDKTHKGKDKKQLEDMDERVNEKEKKERMVDEKTDKLKRKQHLKPPKTILNISEPLTSTKQSKTLGTKIIENAARVPVSIQSKPGKATGAELMKEPDPSESSKTTAGLKDGNTMAAKSKHGKVASPETRPDYLKTTNYKNVEDSWRSLRLEPSQGFGKSWSNVTMKVPTLFQSSATDPPNVSPSKASVDTNVDHMDIDMSQGCQPSSCDDTEVTTLTFSSATKPQNTTTTGNQSQIATPNIQKGSDKGSSEDLEFSLSTSAATTFLVNQTSKVSGSLSNEQKNNNSDGDANLKSIKSRHPKLQTNLGSNGNHASMAAIILKTQKTAFPTEAAKKSENPEHNDTTNIPSIADLASSVPSAATPDHRISRSFVLHNMDPADLNELDFTVSHSNPPPHPSSTPLLVPPPSTPLTPCLSVVSPVFSNPLTLGVGLHPGSHTLRCVDKQKHHGGIYRRLAQQPVSSHITPSVTPQVSGKSLLSEHSFLSDHSNDANSGGAAMTKKISDIHFPGLRGSVLPELRRRHGKHNRGEAKDERKDNEPV
ncbi:hypothetical protein Q5P01_002826 [Channa striata]|uniref:Cyclin-dependent kinase-like 2 n=1 Tax=Channa striata TaxID=64152 RepID=A0AA88NTV0_CHASR|nr:hypothetical protein Q5P01_002826 [Channa striata]